MFGFIKRHKMKVRAEAQKNDIIRRSDIINKVKSSLSDNLKSISNKKISIKCYKGYMMKYPVKDVFFIEIETDYNIWSMDENPIDVIIKTSEELKLHLNSHSRSNGPFQSTLVPGGKSLITYQEFWPEDQYDYDEKMKNILTYPTTKEQERDDKLDQILN